MWDNRAGNVEQRDEWQKDGNLEPRQAMWDILQGADIAGNKSNLKAFELLHVSLNSFKFNYKHRHTETYINTTWPHKKKQGFHKSVQIFKRKDLKVETLSKQYKWKVAANQPAAELKNVHRCWIKSL